MGKDSDHMAELENATETQVTLVDAMNNGLNDVVGMLPSFVINLVFAIVLFVLGWIIALIVGRIVSSILKAVKLETFLKKHKMEDAFGSVKISDVFVKIAKYYVLLVFLQAAVSLVELGTISDFLSSVLVYVPALIGAVIVMVCAVLFGEYVKEKIIELSKSPLVRLSARGAKLVIIYIGLTTALATAGISTILISSVFVTVLQAAVFGIALAIGISFGLGGQDEAKDIIKKGRKQLNV